MPLRLPLANLREMSESFLPDTATIQRPTDTASGDGTSQTWTNVATGVPCRVSPVGHRAQEQMGANAGVQASSLWVVWLPAGTDVTARDRLAVGSRTFEVNSPGARSYEVARGVFCREVT